MWHRELVSMNAEQVVDQGVACKGFGFVQQVYHTTVL
jgi:hypothetical protein